MSRVSSRHTCRVDILAAIDAREPWWDRPGDFPGIGSETYRPNPLPPPALVFRLPPSTSNLLGDWAAARRAVAAATTDEQRAAVALRIESLTERTQLAFRPIAAGLAEAVAALRPAFEQMARSWSAAFESLTKTWNRYPPLPRPLTDARQQALAARRNRSSGPRSMQRAPRTIGRPSTSRRGF